MRFVRPVPAAPLPKPGTGGGALRPSLNLDFSQGTVDSRISFSRANATATYFDATGTMQVAAANQPRIDYGPTPGGRTNWIRNSTMVGAAVGTPGTLPTNWNNQNASGISPQVIGSGIENGISYLDIRYSGTPGVSGVQVLYLEGNTAIPAIQNQVFTVSGYVKLVGGSLTNVGAVKMTMLYLDASQVQVTTAATGSDAIFQPSVAGLATQRASGTYIINGTNAASVVSLRPYLSVAVTSGQAIDVTFRIGAPQIEDGYDVTPWIPTSGTNATVGATALGLLMEQGTTQSIRNPRCEGAVAPSTIPTDWGSFDGLSAPFSGISSSIVGIGYESGVPYIDVAFTGTASASTTMFIRCEGSTQIAGANGQTWSVSSYCKIVSGTLANFAPELFISERDNTGANLAISTYPFTPGTGALAPQRFSATRTNGNASTAFMLPGYAFGITSGGVVSCTLRFGAPQLEQLPFATSVVLPVAGSPATTVRGGDIANIPATGWFNPAAGTLVAEATLAVMTTGQAFIATLNDGTNQNEIRLNVNNGAAANGAIIAANTQTYSGITSTNTIIPDATMRSGIAYGSTTGSFAANGTLVNTGACAGLPTVTTLQIGSRTTGVFTVNGWVRRVLYWPRQQGTVELANSTAVLGKDTSLTLDFGALQPLNSMVSFTRSGAGATYFDYTGTLQTAATNQPRFDFNPVSLQLNGVLIEDGRTNQVTNPRCEGATVGLVPAPGAAPTNMTITASNGIAAQVIGTGVEQGIPYVDVRWFGTPNATGNQCRFTFQNGRLTAGATQAWTQSAYLRVVGGDYTNITGGVFFLEVSYFDNTSTFVGNHTTNVSPTGAALATQRFTNFLTTGATTATIGNDMGFSYTSGQPIDITLRIGGPQLEQAASISSLILPSVGSPAATTRNTEIMTISPLGSWFNASAGTMQCAFNLTKTPDIQSFDATLSDGTNQNEIRLNVSSSDSASAAMLSGGTTTYSGSTATNTVVPGILTKAAIAFSNTNASFACNGVLVQNGGAVSAAPIGLNKLSIGRRGDNSFGAFAWIRAVNIWPRTLSSTELPIVTT